VRIAYLITSYRPPTQLIRLLGVLRRAQPDCQLVVHHDRFRSQWNTDLLDGIGGVHTITSDHPVTWGDFSVVSAQWDGLRWMLEHLEFDWVVFLSEQDYPIAPLAELEHRLSESECDVFCRAETLDQLETFELRSDCDRRYNYQYLVLPRLGLLARLPRAVQARIRYLAGRANYILYRLQRRVTIFRYPDGMPLRLGYRTKHSPFGRDFQCWYGSQWIALSHRGAQVLIDFVDSHPDYVRYYSRTAIPDESATPTIVHNNTSLRVQNEAFHFVRFSGNMSGHPDVFTSGDLDEILASGHSFARKFDVAVDANILDLLDEKIFGPAS
jgi:hypothetical protein